MVTKGIIKSIDLTGNTCKVHMPFFETAGNDPIIATATISNTPGSYNGYKVGDVVLVAFEDNNLDTPVVMGKLYLGVEKEKADPRGVLNVEESSTSKKAALPADSVLTSKVDNNVTNTAAPFGSLSSIANELNTLNTNVDQMDRDYGNRFKQVITEMGNQGENFESKLEQTAQSITATVTSTKEELQENIDAVQDNVDQTNKDLADAKDELSKTITETKTALEVEDGKIKASVEEVSKTVSAHGETIASHTTQISQNTESITLEASARQEAVSNLDNSISENAALIKENAANIKINADSISQEVTAREEALSGAVKELESKITSTSDGINAQVTERLAEKLDIKNNGESTTEEGQVVQHGFGWDLSKDEWVIKAYDQNSEGTLPTDGLDIFKITRDTVEINALNVRLTGYPRETIIRYAYGTKDTYPALYKDNTKKSIKDEFINAAWSKTELPWSETQYIWQWTQTATYEYIEENSNWVDSITDNVVRQSGDSAVSYWLKCSTPIHIGKNQTENILVIPYKKVGTKSEELDTEVYIRYKWVKEDNAEFTSWTKILSSGLTINATDIKASDLLVQVSHDSTGDDRIIYDEETITYSPLNTPIIDLTNDKAIIQYKPNGEQITSAVSSTATVYLGGMILSDTTYKWKKKEGTTSITGTNTSTITVNSITSDTAIITCEATTPFKDETGANVVLSKDFTIFRETITATYNLKVSTPIHTGDLQKTSIKVEALATLGNNPELPDENAYLRYSLNNGTTWQPWVKESEREIVTTGCESDIIVQASHDSGTTIYEQETITYSPLNTPVLDLSNDNATISYNADNTKINNTETVSSTAVVYLNGKRVTSYKIDWSSPDKSCIYTLNEDKHTITITDITNVNNSNIATARCIISEIEGYPNLELTKDFNIIKQVQGVISYSLKTSTDNFVRNTNNIISPDNLTFQIIEKIGNKNSSFVIPTTTNKLRLEVFKGNILLSLTADENNTYTIDNTNININTPIIIKLYQESILIETKTIHVIYSGEQGIPGENNYIIEIDNDFATVPTSVVNKQIYRKDGLLDLPINESITPEIKKEINLPGGVFNPKNIVKATILKDTPADDLELETTKVLRFTPTLNTRAAINKYLPGIPLSIISGPDVENDYQYEHQKNYQFLRAPLISLPEAQLEIKDSTNTVTEYKSYTQDLTTHNVKVYYGTTLEDITMDNFILKLDHDEITLEDLYAEKGNYLVCEIKAYDKDGNLIEDYPSINPTINNNTVTNYITAMSGTTSTVSTVSIIYTYYIVKELEGQKIMTNVASSKVELVRHLGPTTYYMNSSATSIKVDKNNNVTPTEISFTAHKLSTSDNSITDCTTGTWKYYWDTDTSNTQILNNSGSLTINDGDTIKEKVINFKDKNTLTVELYTNDQLWDRSTIDVIKDGSDGQDGREITKITTYYMYSATKPNETDPKWTDDLSNWSEDDLPTGGYYCWRKTVTKYTDGTETVDGPTRDETFALAQGKTTNYYSPTDPAGTKDTDNYGQNIKEGDCWFKTTGTNAELEGNPKTGELKQWDGTNWVDIGSEIVANKLTANYINALDITAKKITVRQDNTTEDSDILFNADGTSEEGQVRIGGFYVTKDAFVGGGVTTNNYCKLNILDTFEVNGNKSSSLVIEDSSWNTINYYTNASQNVTWESVSYDKNLGTTQSQQCIYNGFVTYKCNKTKVWQNSTKENPTISCMILKPNKTLIETKIKEALGLTETPELPSITFSTTINLGIDSPSDINTTLNNQYDYIIASTPFSPDDLGGLPIEEAISDLFNNQDKDKLKAGIFTSYGKIQEYARVSGPRSIGNLENLTKAIYPNLTTDHYIAIFMVNVQQTYFENKTTIYDYDSAGNITGATEINSGSVIPTYGYCCVPTTIEIALQALEIGTNFKVRTDGTMVANNAFVTGTLNIPDTAIIGGFNISKNTLTSATLNVTNNKVKIPSYKPLILGDNFKLISIEDDTTKSWKSRISSNNPLEVLGEDSLLISNNIASDNAQNASILLETIAKNNVSTLSQTIKVITTEGVHIVNNSISAINPFALTPTPDIFLQGGSGLGGITAPIYITKATITAIVYPNSEPTSTAEEAKDSYTITVYYKFGTTWSQTTLAIPAGQTKVSTTVSMLGSSSYPVYYGISKSSSSSASIASTKSPLIYTKYYVGETVAYSPKITLNGTLQGNLTLTGDVCGNAFYASSDRNLKTNIENIKLDSSLDKFYQQLQPVKFNFKTDLNTQHFGFIAQDLNELLSIISTNNTTHSMITKDTNTGYYKVNYNEIIALNTAQIKNIMNYIQELYSQYKTLELKYKKLEEKINENR